MAGLFIAYIYITIIYPVGQMLIWDFEIITPMEKYDKIIAQLSIMTDMRKVDLQYIFPYTDLEEEIKTLAFKEVDHYVLELYDRILEKSTSGWFKLQYAIHKKLNG
ncbi:hypothetical protein ACTA71_009075 [Dictyostelium dimigraforme]